MSLSARSALSEREVCRVLDLNRNTLRSYRQVLDFVGPPRPLQRARQGSAQPRSLSAQEQRRVLTTLNSETHCDQPPAQVYFDLLSHGIYLCSISTMHRLLRRHQQSGERRCQRSAQPCAIPRLHAQKPHEVWTWDITKLPLVQRGVYLSLYVVMDLYSRYIVAWMLSRKENSALACQLIEEASGRYDIAPGQLTIHQDRGAPMTAHCYLDVLGELAVTASHSRPRVSNDNAMSEAQFKTLKYQPDYPRRFDHYAHANAWCTDYVDWYNTAHHHSTLAGFTPLQVFTGEHLQLAAERQKGLDQAYERTPERFTRGRLTVLLPPTDVYINPIVADNGTEEIQSVNFPTLDRARRK